jgi:hypothetical protein
VPPKPSPPADDAAPVAPHAPDTTPPAIGGTADVTAAATGPGGAAVSYPLPSAVDSVDGAVTVVCAPTSGSVFALGSTVVGCSAEDAARNVAHTSFTVKVRDVTGPEVQVPADAEVDTTTGAGAHVSYTATAADAVDGPVSVTCSPASGSLFPIGHSTVTCTAEDAAHNVSHASFDVHVLDDTAPPTVQPLADLTVEAAGPSGATVAYTDPAATDVVDGAVSVACAPASGSVFALGHTTVTCTAEDASHNAGHATFDVQVRDTTGPAIQLHASVVAEADSGTTAVTYSLPTAADAVDGSVPVTCAPTPGSAFALGHTTVTCSATDAAGNASTSTFDVDVRDTTPPSIPAHADVVAEATGPAGAAVTFATPPASDLVDGGVTASCAPSSGSMFPLGHTTITCTASDAAGNASSSTFDVHVRDTTPPAIAAHSDLVAEAAGPGGAAVTYALPAASDLVDGAVAVTCAPSSGATFALGHTTVTCTASDGAGNASTSTFDVAVRDTTPPAIAAHADLVAEATGPAGATLTYTLPAASDLVDGAVTVTCAPSSGATFALGHTTVTCSASDVAGNASTSTFDVHVRDTTPPGIATHADLVAEAAGPTGATVTFALPTGSDLVDGAVTVTCAPASGATFALGHTTVTCAAADAAHNSASSTFDVYVRDTTPPSIAAHADLVADAAGPAGAAVTYTLPAATDLVDGTVTVTCIPGSGAVFALGHTTVTCTASDGAGNGSTSTFDVQVRDTTPPSIATHADVVAEAVAANGATVTYTAPGATDDISGPVTVSCSPASGGTFPLGHTTVTCTAEDAAHNTSTSTFDVDVRDTTAPSIATHASIVAEATGPSGAAVSYTPPAATDSADASVTVTCAPASGSTFPLGHTTVTCTAEDDAHNTASSTFDIHVRDTTAPSIGTHANVVVEATSASGAAVAYTPPAATDSVDASVTVTCAPASGSTFPLGQTTVTCSAQDASGNVAAPQSFDVNVHDTTGPAIQAHANVVVEATGASGATVIYTLPTATDAVSGAATVTCAPASGTTFARGHTTVTCSAQDATNNVSASTFDVYVRDTTAPAISVPASFTVSASSSSGIAVNYAVSATDAVDGTDAVTCTPASGATFRVGHTTVTCTATDAAGNSASRSFDVVVTTAQAVSDATAAGQDIVSELGSLGLTQAVYDDLNNRLNAAGDSLLQDGDAVTAWQQFNGFDAAAQAQLTAAQYSQLSPYILNVRSILGW